MIGALGRALFTAAATLTRLAPQFATGHGGRARPMSGLIVEAGIRGVAVPLTAAAVGGLIGAALWFTRPPNKAHQHRECRPRAPGGASRWRCWPSTPTSAWSTSPDIPQMAAAGRAISLSPRWRCLLLRVGLHLALLHEAHDEIQSDEPMLCPHCGHVVPDMAFCPACGVATQASSRSSRRERRERGRRAPGTDAAGWRHAARLFHDAGTYTAPPLRRTSYVRLLRTWGVAVVVVAVALVGLSIAHPQAAGALRLPAGLRAPAHRQAGRDQPAVHRRRRLLLRLLSRPRARRTRSPRTPTASRADLLGGDGGTHAVVQSSPPTDAPPRTSPRALSSETFPDTKTAYEIPNAMVGYQPGYGVVADCWPQGANASYMRMRVIVMVAVKNDLALVAAAVGPFRAVRPGLRRRASRRARTSNRPRHGQVRQQLHLARRPALARRQSGL